MRTHRHYRACVYASNNNIYLFPTTNILTVLPLLFYQ